MNILFTGFEPFGNWAVNPTHVAAEHLNGMKIGKNSEFNLISDVVPLRYYDILPHLTRLIEKYDPKMIILSGQAGGDKIRLERQAFNIVETTLPYNCGTELNGKLFPSAQEMYRSSLPLDLIYSGLKDDGIPVEFSDSAGSFGCNQIFYLMRHQFNRIPAGFIHVPLLKEQVKEDQVFMDQEMITRGLELATSISGKWLSEKLI
jgi:pyroglutamyl-peptidase